MFGVTILLIPFTEVYAVAVDLTDSVTLMIIMKIIISIFRKRILIKSLLAIM